MTSTGIRSGISEPAGSRAAGRPKPRSRSDRSGTGPAARQIWGVNLQRYTQWKNESSTLNRIPVALGEMGIMQMSLAGPLVGLEAPPASRNLEIKPYLVADMESDRLGQPGNLGMR